MEDQVTDNQTQAAGAPDNNGAVTNDIENIMGGMSETSTPETKPVDTNGDKAEGKETQTAAELPAWTQQLPKEMRENADVMKQLSKFKTIGDVAKSFSELETKLGKSLIQPADDASDEVKNAFWEKLGKPKSVNDYSINDENAAVFKELAFKNNLTDAQATAIYGALQDVGKAAVEQQQAAFKQQAQATTAALKAEYGNQYNAKIEMLKRGVQKYGGQALGDKLKATGLIADADVVKMFIKLGEQSAEAGSANNTTPPKDKYVSTAEGGKFSWIK